MHGPSHPLFGVYQKKRAEWEQSLQQESYSVAEAAKVLHLGERRVRRLVDEGEITATKIGERGTIIPKQAIVNYLVPSPFGFFGENF